MPAEVGSTQASLEVHSWALAVFSDAKLYFFSISISHFLLEAGRLAIFSAAHLCLCIENMLFNRKYRKVPSSVGHLLVAFGRRLLGKGRWHFEKGKPTYWTRNKSCKRPALWYVCLDIKKISSQEQSWALPVFFHFFNNKKWFFCTFYKVHNLFLHQSYLKSSLPVKLTW